jgi:DNA-binding transcriptional regulator GbsR (MarR family)
MRESSPEKTQGRLPPEIEDLADQIGSFIEYWGFKKVHGQIWCHLSLSLKPLDASELRERLSVSKALVSVSLKELLEFGVIHECGKSERGTRLYRAVDDVMIPIIEILRRRERRMLSRIESAYHLLGRLSSEEALHANLDPLRVAYVGQLISLAGLGLDHLIKGGGPTLPSLLAERDTLRPSHS